ncbi:MAG: hypothetical protein QXI39_09895 [Candidatus Bathyarchaeia archaeon]
MVKCPVCGRESKSEPFKAWKFRFYQVKRYQCSLCSAKFNVYESEKSMFTIPKARG